MVTFGSVKEKTFELIEQGEYVLTLSELEVVEGQWGDRMAWKFLVAPKEDYTAYVCDKNGEERTVWVFTDVDIILGSLAHEFVEKMTGRTFTQDTDPPDEDDLLGKRVIGYLTHETPTRGKNAGKKREAIVAGSIKPFRGPSKKVAPNVAPPPESDDEEQERLLLVNEANRIVGKAVKLETPSHAEWTRSDISKLSVDALHVMIRDATAEVQAALDS